MRVGYGYRRTEKDFAGANVDSVFIDTPASDRSERYSMFNRRALRKGDTLVLLGRGDLGYGKELQRLRKRLEEMGVEIEYFEDEPAPKGARGRPKGFDPTPEQDARYKSAWHDEDRTSTYCLKIARRDGHEVELHHFKYRYGKRFPDQS